MNPYTPRAASTGDDLDESRMAGLDRQHRTTQLYRDVDEALRAESRLFFAAWIEHGRIEDLQASQRRDEALAARKRRAR